MYRLYAAQTTTGQVMGPLPGNLQSWSRVLNGLDAASLTMYPDAADGLNVQSRDRLRAWTAPPKMSLLIDWEGTLLYAGPIWTRQWDGSALTISSSGIRSLLALRKLISLTSATPFAQQTFAFTDSLPHIMQQLVQLTISSGLAGASLPIEFEANSWGDGYQPAWYGFDLPNIDDVLTDLMGYDQGPDLDFQPVWDDAGRSSFHWVMRTGSPYLVGSNILSLDGSVPLSPVATIQSTEDASKMSTVQHAKGSGSDVDTLLSHLVSRTYTQQGWPLVEQETDYTTVTDQPTLDQHVAGDQAAHAAPTEQRTVTVAADQAPPLGSYDLGDLVVLTIKDHVWIPDEDSTQRIIQYAQSSDSANAIDLTMQEEPDASD